jgi:hypothetical protein
LLSFLFRALSGFASFEAKGIWSLFTEKTSNQELSGGALLEKSVQKSPKPMIAFDDNQHSAPEQLSARRCRLN